jgi:hypothetical protein
VVEHQDAAAAPECANVKAGAKVREAIGAYRHGIVFRRCRRICSEEFLLFGRERIRVGQSRGNVPISVIKHHFEGIPTSVAEMPDSCTIGIGHRMPLGIDQGLGQVAVVDPTYIELRCRAMLLKISGKCMLGSSLV